MFIIFRDAFDLPIFVIQFAELQKNIPKTFFFEHILKKCLLKLTREFKTKIQKNKIIILVVY